MADTLNHVDPKSIVLVDSNLSLNDLNTLVSDQEKLIITANTSNVLQHTLSETNDTISQNIGTLSNDKIKLPISISDGTTMASLSSEVFSFDSSNQLITQDFILTSSEASSLNGNKTLTYATLPIVSNYNTITLNGTSLGTPISLTANGNQIITLPSSNNLALAVSDVLTPNTSTQQNNFSQEQAKVPLSSVLKNVSLPNVNMSRTTLVTKTTPAISKPQVVSSTSQKVVSTNANANSFKGQTSTILAPRLTLPIKTKSTAPLGSSDNPIQIIQQGNTYHSTQNLTQEQLQQIAQVLHQQKAGKNIQAKGGKAVLYNPSTNTKIIYRVIYPAQLQKKSEETVIKGRGRGRPPRKKSNTFEDPNPPPRLEDTELTKEEKEARKKMRPRTRSGRVSKPPSYMIKDYKRIHHLDFDEEVYDDSDGGYSDYIQSDDENHQDLNNSLNSSNVSKPRRFKCKTCDKAYVGQAGLARHYRLNPNHGDEKDIDEIFSFDENSNSSLQSSNVGGGGGGGGPPGADTEDSSQAEPPHKKARSSHLKEFHSNRRKARLREAMNHCHDEELIEVVMPRVVKLLSAWEFLVAKSLLQDGATDDVMPNYSKIFSHLGPLITKLRMVSSSCLTPSSSYAIEMQQHQEPSSPLIDVSDQGLSNMLGLAPGLYNFHIPAAELEKGELFKCSFPMPIISQNIKPSSLPQVVKLSKESCSLLEVGGMQSILNKDLLSSPSTHSLPPPPPSSSSSSITETTLQHEISHNVAETAESTLLSEPIAAVNSAELQDLLSKNSTILTFPTPEDTPPSLLLSSPSSKIEDIPGDKTFGDDGSEVTTAEALPSGAMPLVLPSGQVIGMWCGGQVTVDPAFLPSNMVIVDSTTGSTTDTISLETLQALLGGLDQSSSNSLLTAAEPTSSTS